MFKGESSYWFNKNNKLSKNLSWQDDYWAVIVSESYLVRVRNYISNLEEHHIKKSFSEEVEEFMEKYDWEVTVSK